jgi:hypothetical protein
MFCCGSCRCMCCCSVTKMATRNLQQRYAIRFCVKLGQGATDAYENIQKAFGNDSISRTEVFRWHKNFVNWRETVEDEPRSGPPPLVSVRTSTNIGRVRAFICQDRRLTIRMIAD